MGASNVVKTGVAAGDMKATVEAVAAGGGLSAVASAEGATGEQGGEKSEADGAKGGEDGGDDGEGKDGDDDDDNTPPREFPAVSVYTF